MAMAVSIRGEDRDAAEFEALKMELVGDMGGNAEINALMHGPYVPYGKFWAIQVVPKSFMMYVLAGRNKIVDDIVDGNEGVQIEFSKRGEFYGSKTSWATVLIMADIRKVFLRALYAVNAELVQFTERDCSAPITMRFFAPGSWAANIIDLTNNSRYRILMRMAARSILPNDQGGKIIGILGPVQTVVHILNIISVRARLRGANKFTSDQLNVKRHCLQMEISKKTHHLAGSAEWVDDLGGIGQALQYFNLRATDEHFDMVPMDQVEPELLLSMAKLRKQKLVASLSAFRDTLQIVLGDSSRCSLPDLFLDTYDRLCTSLDRQISLKYKEMKDLFGASTVVDRNAVRTKLVKFIREILVEIEKSELDLNKYFPHMLRPLPTEQPSIQNTVSVSDDVQVIKDEEEQQQWSTVELVEETQVASKVSDGKETEVGVQVTGKPIQMSGKESDDVQVIKDEEEQQQWSTVELVEETQVVSEVSDGKETEVGVQVTGKPIQMSGKESDDVQVIKDEEEQQQWSTVELVEETQVVSEVSDGKETEVEVHVSDKPIQVAGKESDDQVADKPIQVAGKMTQVTASDDKVVGKESDGKENQVMAKETQVAGKPIQVTASDDEENQVMAKESQVAGKPIQVDGKESDGKDREADDVVAEFVRKIEEENKYEDTCVIM